MRVDPVPIVCSCAARANCPDCGGRVPQIATVRRLYVALKSMPCRCTRRWKKPTQNDDKEYEIIHKCSRCIALESYDAEIPPQ
jgi:hypothetical protein